jgi:hypothetical protein
MNREGGGRVRRRWGVALAAPLAIAAFALPASASANVPFQRITSPGPVSDIYLGNELSCQVKLTQDMVFSYFPPGIAPGDCGTFLTVEPFSSGDPLYGPNFPAHDGSATFSLPNLEPWNPVSQTGVTGSGTQADPYAVETLAAAGTEGIQVRERYTYVTGSRGYDVEITVINNNATSRSVKLYHAVDCYLAGSDFGYGFFDSSTGGIFCTENANNSPAGRVLGFTPGSPANYIEDDFDTVWARTNGTNYPNTAEPTVFQDNGVGLQFNLTVPGTLRSTRASTTINLRGTVDSGDALETAILSGPKKKVKSKKKKKKAKFTFQASLGGVPQTGATFTCTVDNKPPVACTSPYSTKVKRGKHTFSVAATLAGETDSTPAAQSWKLKRKKKKK